MLKLKLISRFYKGFFLADFLVTLSCAYILKLYAAQANKIIGYLFWFKLATLAIIFYSSVYHRKNELYYYQNLGVLKIQLVLVTSAFDMLIWFILITIVY